MATQTYIAVVTATVQLQAKSAQEASALVAHAVGNATALAPAHVCLVNVDYVLGRPANPGKG